jgi:hypothetical protein
VSGFSRTVMIMKELIIGGTRYRLDAVERDGRWLARAVRAETGDPFGVETSGSSQAVAIDRLEKWIDWQHEHAAALEALQQTENAYHRTIAGSAFANPTEGPTPIEMQRDALELVEAARSRLDELRARKPQ